MATCWANSVLLLSHILGIGLESEGGHHPNGDLTVTKKTKRVKVCGTKIAPTMREYFFIHLHGRNPWGGRQRGWHPPEVGDKGVWHASILSQLRALHGARCQCQEQSTCAATVCQLSEGSHQPCELSHHPSVLHLTDPSLLSVGLGSHHWCYQILPFMSLKNHAPCKPLNFPPCSAGDNGD